MAKSTLLSALNDSTPKRLTGSPPLSAANVKSLDLTPFCFPVTNGRADTRIIESKK